MSLQIVEWAEFLADSFKTEKSAMTIGVFDGVHLGHRELIEKVVRRGPNPTVVSFRENPKKRVSPASYNGDLFSLKQKLAVFESLGVGRVVLIDFSEDFSKLKGSEFLDLLEEKGRMAFLVIGSNFRCGFKKDTDARFIREMNEKKGIPTEVIPPVALPEEMGSGSVSSSRIRSAIISGDIRMASVLMGRNVELDLSDIKGELLPKENLKVKVYDLRSVQRISPKAGRYAVLVHPGGISCRADAENGKIFLYVEHNSEERPVERLEIINGYPI
jgi:riboflavin kinase/FMN adenylyltransferase